MLIFEKKGSKDNLSVVLINFNDSEIQSDEDKATADEKLNEEICEKTEGQSYLLQSRARNFRSRNFRRFG